LDPPVFSRAVQERFAAIGEIVGNHIDEGPDGINQLRALIGRAEEFATFSSYHEHPDETDDNREIADRLNAAGTSAAISRLLMDRELGKRGLRPPKDIHDVDILFTDEEARKLTDELGHLLQDIGTRLSTIDNIFAEQSNNRVARTHGNIRREIALLSSRLGSQIVDPTLARIDHDLQKEKDRTQRAASDDSFFSSSSPASPPVVAPPVSAGQTSLRRRRDAISLSDDDASAPPARRRRLGTRSNSPEEPASQKRGESDSREHTIDGGSRAGDQGNGQASNAPRLFHGRERSREGLDY
jgi:hypothetical protein